MPNLFIRVVTCCDALLPQMKLLSYFLIVLRHASHGGGSQQLVSVPIEIIPKEYELLR